MDKEKTYKKAGVDIEKGNAFVQFIKSFSSPVISPELGGFSGGIELDLHQYRQPYLMGTTDGVGTKLLVAETLQQYDTVGIDLVAMCVNDLLVCNVKPMLFWDYLSCEQLQESTMQEVMTGIIKGCEEAGCILAGGETAELPGLYQSGFFDIAGFCLGIGEKSDLLPQTESIAKGDVLMGLPSNGIHSNGLSLARSSIPKEERRLYRELLRPTKIYKRDLDILLSTGYVKAAAHITGGGLQENVVRVLPPHVKPRFSYDWQIPEIFTAIQRLGLVSDEEMYRVFNMGIGIVCVIDRGNIDQFVKTCETNTIPVCTIGELIYD